MQKTHLPIILLLLSSLILAACEINIYPKQSMHQREQVQTTISSGLDDQYLPIDSLSKIRLSQYELIIHNQWLHTQTRDYQTSCQIYGPNQQLLFSAENDFTGGNSNTITWCRYPLRHTDPAGLWEIHIYLQQELISQKTIRVRPE